MTITLDVSFPDVMNDVLLDKYKIKHGEDYGKNTEW